MATPKNSPSANSRESSTAKCNFHTTKLGQKDGSIAFGRISKDGTVISDVSLQAEDGRHQISLDKDGPRKGWTSSTSPGNFQVLCGLDKDGETESLVLCAQNGNIAIRALNGRVRIEGLDIDLIAKGPQGNIHLVSNEGIKLESKNIVIDASSAWKIASTGLGEIVANSTLEMYSSMIRGVTDSVALRDSKVGGKDVYQKNNKLA